VLKEDDMRKIVEYMCEICHRKYKEEKHALECENRLVPVEYPIGLIHGDNRKGAFYEKIVFAVGKNNINQHWNSLSLWACRDTGMGDSLGEHMCGSNHVNDKLTEHDAHVDQDSPMFKRMIAYLKEQGIPITIWNGTEAVLWNS